MKQFFLIFLCFCYFFTVDISQAQTAQEYYEKASQYKANKEYEKAIDYYSLAILKNENFANAYAERGYAYSNLDIHQKALNDYNQALELEGLQYKYLVYFNRAWAKYNLGQKKEACPDWQKALDLGYEKAQETLEKYCESEK